MEYWRTLEGGHWVPDQRIIEQKILVVEGAIEASYRYLNGRVKGTTSEEINAGQQRLKDRFSSLATCIVGCSITSLSKEYNAMVSLAEKAIFQDSAQKKNGNLSYEDYVERALCEYSRIMASSDPSAKSSLLETCPFITNPDRAAGILTVLRGYCDTLPTMSYEEIYKAVKPKDTTVNTSLFTGFLLTGKDIDEKLGNPPNLDLATSLCTEFREWRKRQPVDSYSSRILGH